VVATLPPESILEHRFLPSREQANRFLAEVASRLTIVIHDPARPVGYCRTTYLDTPGGEYHRTSRTPLARRLRVREYAAAASLDDPARLTGACHLELKETCGSLRMKRRSQLGGELARRDVLPVVTTWYRRLELVDGGVRVTFDEELAFGPPVPLGQAPRWLSAAMDELLPAQTVRFSKFAAAMVALKAAIRPGAASSSCPTRLV
jgi:hypothetical protein